MAGTDAPAPRLDALRAILVTAHELATKLAADPLVERILRGTIPRQVEYVRRLASEVLSLTAEGARAAT